MNIKNRVALVTGSGQGLGEAIIKNLANQGAIAVVCDMNLDNAKRVASEIEAGGGSAWAVQANCTVKADVEKVVQEIIEKYGRLEILVNNVGIIRDNYMTKISELDWDSVLDTNLKSYFLVSQAAVPHMMERRYGRIINISSRAWLGNVGQANYSAAKGGVVSLSRVMAMEYGKYNITSNVVAPGVIDSPMYRGLREDVQERMRKAQPIPVIGTPQDVAFAVQFFASDEAWYINGQCLYVCGGKSVFSSMG